jgi:catechol 2,3-dioxygenase-like lactoylglutathione lyase family enzyme
MTLSANRERDVRENCAGGYEPIPMKETNMQQTGLPGLSHVDHVGLTVPDLDAAVNFYRDVIGGVELFRVGPLDASALPKMPDGRDWTEAYLGVADARAFIAMLQVGSNLMLELFQYEKPLERRSSPPRNCDPGGHHIAFKVADIIQAVSYLRGKGVRVFEGPAAIESGPNAGVKWIYFLDPWGNQLELFEYSRQAFEAFSPAAIYRPAPF